MSQQRWKKPVVGWSPRIYIRLFFSAKTFFFREDIFFPQDFFFVRGLLLVLKPPFLVKMHILMLLYILSTKNLHFTNFLMAIDRHFSWIFSPESTRIEFLSGKTWFFRDKSIFRWPPGGQEAGYIPSLGHSGSFFIWDPIWHVPFGPTCSLKKKSCFYLNSKCQLHPPSF